MKNILKIFLGIYFLLFSFASAASKVEKIYKGVLEDDIISFDPLSMFFGDFHINGNFALKGVSDNLAIETDFLYHIKSDQTSKSPLYNNTSITWTTKGGFISFAINFYPNTAPFKEFFGIFAGYFVEKYSDPKVAPGSNITLKTTDVKRKNTAFGIQAGYNYIFSNNMVISLKVMYPILVFGDDPVSVPPVDNLNHPRGYIYIGYKF